MKLDSSISAVITGGASGLGAATARLLASHGVKVGIFDLNEELGEKIAKELGGVFCKVNVTSTPEVDAAFAKSRAAIGQERILVNCAGVGGSVKTVSRDKVTPRDQGISAGEFRADHPDQPDRHLPLHHQERGRHAEARSAARRRPRRDRQHRLRRGRRRPDRPGCLHGLEGRHRRHHADGGARSFERRHPLQHHPARHLRHAAARARAGEREGRAWRRRCRSRAGSASRRNTRSSRTP